MAGATCWANIASMTAFMAQPILHQRQVPGLASGLKFMSAQRMTRELRRVSAGAAARQLRLATSLIVLAIPLSGCGTGALWDKFLAKDDTFVDEPADKLYNEGLYLMNQKNDTKTASQKFGESESQHPDSGLVGRSNFVSA